VPSLETAYTNPLSGRWLRWLWRQHERDLSDYGGWLASDRTILHLRSVLWHRVTFIMIPPTMNMMPFTIAADCPTTSTVICADACGANGPTDAPLEKAPVAVGPI
jgi:hypothetical protein